MDSKVFNVLFLCTGNSARSIMGECILNREGMGKFKGYSAGSQPKGEILPTVRTFLEGQNYDIRELYSKVWDVYAEKDAPKMDFVFTVCDNAAGEVCPIWPGHPLTAHWGVSDPATFDGTETESQQYVSDIYNLLLSRIRTFVNLPLESIDTLTLKKQLVSIGAGGSNVI